HLTFWKIKSVLLFATLVSFLTSCQDYKPSQTMDAENFDTDTFTLDSSFSAKKDSNSKKDFDRNDSVRICRIEANSDRFDAEAGEALQLDVLANDSTDCSSLKIIAVTQPAQGSAQIVEQGSRILYEARIDAQGTDRLSYTISNGKQRATADVS